MDWSKSPIHFCHTEVARAEAERRSRSRLMRVRIAEVSHNFFYFMRFFAFAQNDRIINYPRVVDCYVTSPLSP